MTGIKLRSVMQKTAVEDSLTVTVGIQEYGKAARFLHLLRTTTMQHTDTMLKQSYHYNDTCQTSIVPIVMADMAVPN